MDIDKVPSSFISSIQTTFTLHMEIYQGFSLRTLNTFGLEASAEHYIRIENIDDAQEARELSGSEAPFILGGGSNVLFTSDIPGYTWHNSILGIEEQALGDGRHRLTVGAGVPWHELVLYAVNRGYGGIENLSLIPGSSGAAPMQNIGAYGVEIEQVFHSLKALHLPSGEIHSFDRKSCGFGYRESVFKRALKNQYLILSISLELDENASLNTSYGAIEQELERNQEEASIQSISKAVIRIRRSKLPDPASIGNAGSFFKNPVISQESHQRISLEHPSMPSYPAPSGIKVAAGWLIERAGWKGHDRDGYGVHDRQALVLVNRGKGTGKKIYDLSEEIIESVEQQFGIRLEREVNII